MSTLLVGVGDCKVTSEPGATLATYGLGSCIAVVLFDPVAGVAGMLHFLLPESSLDAQRAASQPDIFADTGIARLLRLVDPRGEGRRHLRLALVGGAQVADPAGAFHIGKRNHQAARRLLWREQLLPVAEAVGGMVSRNVTFEVGTAQVWVREGGSPARELVGLASTGKARRMVLGGMK